MIVESGGEKNVSPDAARRAKQLGQESSSESSSQQVVFRKMPAGLETLELTLAETLVLASESGRKEVVDSF